MGYTTTFNGQFDLNKPLDYETKAQLSMFAEERHEQSEEPDVPGYYCQWVPNDDGTAIEWDGQEKFYEYIAWIHYLVDNFLKPKGYILNGEVDWRGEDDYDLGMIRIRDNKITALEGKITYKEIG